MQSTPQSSSRKKFLIWSAAILGSASVLPFFSKRQKKPDTVRMLTQDGKLVEIDPSHLVATGKKISDKELQQWVKK